MGLCVFELETTGAVKLRRLEPWSGVAHGQQLWKRAWCQNTRKSTAEVGLDEVTFWIGI